jgi:hypothetical protein
MVADKRLPLDRPYVVIADQITKLLGPRALWPANTTKAPFSTLDLSRQQYQRAAFSAFAYRVRWVFVARALP